MTAVNDVFDNVADVFAGIDTEPLHTAHVKENFNYVEHVEIVLGKKLTRKKKVSDIYLFWKVCNNCLVMKGYLPSF